MVLDILDIILSNNYLYSNLYLEDGKCAKEIGAPVKCIAPLKGLMKSIIDGIDGSCPPLTMLDWLKDLKNIKEKCLDKNGKIYFYDIQTSYNLIYF